MTKGKHILIVEDEPMIGMILEDFLEALGYRVANTADTLTLALSIAGQGGFDAAILDCNLGHEKVWPVASLLQETGTPFLFATGGDAEEIPSCFANVPTLEKPFTMDTVEKALDRLFLTV